MYQGDIRLGDTIDFKFTTRSFTTGAPTTLSGSPAVAAYVGNGTTEITAGITLSVDFDSRTGLNNVRVVASSGNGFATATNIDIVITAGTVGGVSVVGEVVGSFSIENRSAVMPATAGQTLAVTSAGGVTLGDAVAHGGTLGSSTATLALSRVNVTSQTANTSAFTATGNGTGDGFHLTGGATSGDGLHSEGGASGGEGIHAVSNGGNAPGALFAGVGTGAGLQTKGGLTGPGALFAGGNTSGEGISVTTASGNAVTISGPVALSSTLTVTGAVTLSSTLGVSGTVTFNAFTVTNALTVSGATTFTGAITGTNASNNLQVNTVLIDSNPAVQTIRSGTAQAGGSTSITLDSGASSSNNFYNNDLIYITSGTGAGQSRFITAYNGTTKVATVTAWVTNPDNTSQFAILPFDAIVGATAPTAAQNATAVWQDLLSGSDFSTVGSIGKLLKDNVIAPVLTGAQIATALWQDTTAGDFTTAGSIGKSLFTSGVAPGASGGLLIAGSNAATTFSGLTTGALSCTTITASGAVAFQSTFVITGATTLTGAITATNAGNSITGVSASLAAGALTDTAIATSGANRLADTTRRRTQANVEASSYGDSLSLPSEYGFIQQAQESDTTTTPGSLTVFKTDGTTVLGSRTITTNPSAEPVTGVS